MPHTLWNIIRKVFAVIEKIFEFLSMVMLIAMVCIITYQVVMRYVFNRSPSWSEEIAILLMVWFGILSIPIGVKLHLHIGIEYFYNKFPRRIQVGIARLISVLIVGFGIIMLFAGIELFKFMSMSTLPATKLPSSVLYGVIPPSGLMLIFNALENLFTPFDELQAQIRQARGEYEDGFKNN